MIRNQGNYTKDTILGAVLHNSWTYVVDDVGWHISNAGLTEDGNWNTLDLTVYGVPASAAEVMLIMQYKATATGKNWNFRKYGSSWAVGVGISSQVVNVMERDQVTLPLVDGKVEYLFTDATGSYYLMVMAYR